MFTNRIFKWLLVDLSLFFCLSVIRIPPSFGGHNYDTTFIKYCQGMTFLLLRKADVFAQAHRSDA